MRTIRAFTLTELLIVVALIAVIISVLISSLSQLRHSSRVVKDLSNLRQLQLAHAAYMTAHDGRFIDMNLAHAGMVADPSIVPWIESLETYLGGELSVRSPLDNSPHWPTDLGGQSQPLETPTADGYEFRRTSYGCNAFLSYSLAPSVEYAITQQSIYVYDRLSRVHQPSSTIDFLLMAETGGYAGSDHVHPEQWSEAGTDAAPAIAAEQLHTSAAGGPEKSWDSRSNYGFLDGHAETAAFHRVYLDAEHNFFDPARVQAFLLRLSASD